MDILAGPFTFTVEEGGEISKTGRTGSRRPDCCVSLFRYIFSLERVATPVGTRSTPRNSVIHGVLIGVTIHWDS